MTRRTLIRTALLLTLYLAIRPGPAGAAQENKPAPPAPDGFQPTTTHIEADPWRVMKIEKPEPDRPRQGTIASEKKSPTTLDLNLLGLFLLNVQTDEQKRVNTKHVGILEIPFFVLNTNRHEFINAYWFALYDYVMLNNYEKIKENGGEMAYKRTAWLDVPILFTLFEKKFDAPAKRSWEILDLPLITTLAHKTDKNRDTWKVLNVPLAWGYRYERKGEEKTFDLLVFPLAELFEGHTGAGHSRWTLLDLPFCNLANGLRTKESRTLTVLRAPLLYLFQSAREPAKSTFRLLRVPLLGPLVSYTRGGEKSGVHPLPGIFHGE